MIIVTNLPLRCILGLQYSEDKYIGYGFTMEKKKFTYWQDEDMWLGYLEEYPDYWTQGETEAELRENLLDILRSAMIGYLSVSK